MFGENAFGNVIFKIVDLSLRPERVKTYRSEWSIYASVIYTSIGSDNGLSPGRHQAVIWTNAGILLIGQLSFSEIWIEIHTSLLKKIHLKISSGNWRQFCLGLNVLTPQRSTGRVCFKRTHFIEFSVGNATHGPLEDLNEMLDKWDNFNDQWLRYMYLWWKCLQMNTTRSYSG